MDKSLVEARKHLSEDSNTITKQRKADPVNALLSTKTYAQSMKTIHEVATSVYGLDKEERKSPGLLAIAVLSGEIALNKKKEENANVIDI